MSAKKEKENEIESPTFQMIASATTDMGTARLRAMVAMRELVRKQPLKTTTAIHVGSHAHAHRPINCISRF